jgi:hypothetical protein
MLYLESETLILSNFHGIFIIFRNNLDKIFYFYHGTNVGASSSKACIYNVYKCFYHSTTEGASSSKPLIEACKILNSCIYLTCKILNLDLRPPAH